jgi:hypothetical protein
MVALVASSVITGVDGVRWLWCLFQGDEGVDRILLAGVLTFTLSLFFPSLSVTT